MNVIGRSGSMTGNQSERIMKRTTMATAAALAGGLTLAAPLAAQEVCAVEGDYYDLDAAGVDAFYNCMSDRMVEGYTSEGNEIAAIYRDWTPTATRAAVPGPHGDRFLLTFANDVAAEQYLKFEEGDFEMPVGSVLVKESIAVREGTGRVGPLFIMTKVDDAPDNDNWLYSAVQPNGKDMKIKQSFCSDCHVGFDSQDSMGYPLEEVRLTAN